MYGNDATDILSVPRLQSGKLGKPVTIGILNFLIESFLEYCYDGPTDCHMIQWKQIQTPLRSLMTSQITICTQQYTFLQ